MISIIVAVAENNVIGKENALLWKLPADLKRFKELTTGHAIIMGRKTYESIGRPLPNRRNIVVTRQTDFKPEGVEVAHSLDEALELAILSFPRTRESRENSFDNLDPRVSPSLRATDERSKPEDDNLFVIGGAEIYRQALPLADRIYLTKIHAQFEGDAYFPELGPEWRETSREAGTVDEKNTLPHDFLVYERTK